MKTIIAIIVIFISIKTLAEEVGLEVSNISVKGIYLSSSEASIKKSLGSYEETEKVIDEATTEETWYIRTENLVVFMSNDGILNLVCSGDCSTSFGVQVGSSISQVVARIGEPNSTSDTHMSYVLFEQGQALDAALVFRLEEGLVKEIVYWVAYI